MRHRHGLRKLNKKSSARKSLLRGMATELVRHGRIETTLQRAKELRRVVEPLVTLAKKDGVASRRMAARRLYGPDVVKRLFADIGPLNKDRAGGYTRILRLGFRAGDNAHRALIEFVDMPKSWAEYAAKPVNGSKSEIATGFAEGGTDLPASTG